MGEPQVQWRMIEIREAQAARNRDRIALIDAQPERERKGETSDQKAHEDREGDPIVLVVRPPVHPVGPRLALDHSGRDDFDTERATKRSNAAPNLAPRRRVRSKARAAPSITMTWAAPSRDRSRPRQLRPEARDCRASRSMSFGHHAETERFAERLVQGDKRVLVRHDRPN
jgi:hypothetical protein